MKKILLCLFFLGVTFSSAQAGFFDDFIDNNNQDVIYCNGDDCGLQEGIELIKGGINDIEKNRTLSQYIQDVISYLLMFLSFIAVVYIIYAGFNILTGNGDEEKLKHSRSIIVYVIIGLAIIWFAWPLTRFILTALSVT